MNRTSFIVAIVWVLVSITSCQKLDIKPVNLLTDDQVFTSEAGVTGYLAQVYRKLPIEDFTYRPDGGFNRHHEWEHFYHQGAACGEMVGPWGGTDNAGGFGYWPYDDIRAVNYFMETLPKYAANFVGNRVNELTGEAYFLRAYYYFALAKRYGGIPLIKSVQNYPQQSIEELQVLRDKEEDVWNFIGEDLDKAYSLLPETSAKERANKYVAMALKSRAMLYAGSIARYGSQNFVDGDARAQGYVGIPANKAEGFYNKSIDAAKILEGHYSLYRGKADKIENYVNVFLDNSSPENILIRGFYANEPERCHSWDATFSPNTNSMTAGGLSRAYPTLEFVERFGTLDVTNPDGTPRIFNSRSEITQGLEPRLRATVYFPGDVLRNLPFDIQAGVYPTLFSGTAANEVSKSAASRSFLLSSDNNALWPDPQNPSNPANVLIIGKVGMYSPVGASPDNNTRTGFYVRKYIDPKKSAAEVALFTSTTPWIEFRYAEMLLNRAESDIETGKNADALICLNDIRERAGAPLLTLADMTVDVVRNERCKELAFENHYWWDLKRWRTADVVLNNTRFKGLMPYLLYDQKKYIFLKEPETFGRNYNFEKKFYYEPIPGGELGKNPNLYPNNPNY